MLVKKWTKVEDTLLKKHYPVNGSKIKSLLINRSKIAIRMRARRLKIGKNKIILEDCKELAKNKNGECLALEYKGQNSLMTWECNVCKHIWEAKPADIKQGHWCPKCVNCLKLTLEECNELAHKKDGRCLSIEYITIITPMLWECEFGHQWEAPFNAIKNKNSWCPYCSKAQSRPEEICRNLFEYFFNKPFPKKRPKWLRNPKTGHPLELDGYNEELKIAFEYNGIQHYEKVAYMTEYDLVNIQYKDNIKIETCIKKRVKLVIIPYYHEHKFTPIEIVKYVLYRIKLAGLKYEKNIYEKINLDSIFNIPAKNKIKIAEELAKKVNLIFLGLKNEKGKFIKKWISINHKYWYKCLVCNSYSFKLASGVQQGFGCKCRVRKQNAYSFEEAKEVVKKLKIKNSKEYSKKYKQDPKLPSRPSIYYGYFNQWTNWYAFLGTSKKKFYTYEKACKVVVCLNITTSAMYHSYNKEDPKLPSNPHIIYKDKGWIDWGTFLSTHVKWYSFLEAKKLVQEKNIKTSTTYKNFCVQDLKLPPFPHCTYKKDWIDWYDFLGKKKNIKYESYYEAKKANNRLNINSYMEYRNRHKEDINLPAAPDVFYKNKDWTNWYDFLGKPIP